MGQPDSNKGSYQKCQFLIVTLLAACHMGFVRCPYSNAVLKVWGEAVQTHLNGTTAYNRRYFAVKEKKNSKAGVGG